MRESDQKVLFLLLDAFRHDYINSVDTPFLYSKISQGVYAKKLKSVAGFTQRTAIYTGTTGVESGMFTMFTFDSARSPFRFLQGSAKLRKFSSGRRWWDALPAWPGFGLLREILNRCFQNRLVSFREWIAKEAKNYAAHAPLAQIPLYLLPEIGVSEDNLPVYLPGAFKQESIFDVFQQTGILYEYLMYPVIDCQDDDVLEAFIQKRESASHILLGQFSDSDMIVHHCGPDSYERRKVAGEIDRKLREIAASYGNNTTWIIVGDHGMTEVKEEIDVPALLAPIESRLNVEMGRDYLLFLDSTMARFRWKSEAGKLFLDEVKKQEQLLKKGFFIDEKLANEYSIPYPDKRYGDLIWWANNGVLLFPDYFHDRHTHVKGMHGYRSDHDDMKGFFLAFGPEIQPRVIEEVNLIDVCPSICAAVAVRSTESNRGTCLLVS
ncbi:MAG: alkaline phosphatase family protein [Deltaproteobacteria bacterium]|nr:alkaline phosphatase family protein [Deltaproteobacteria bacterium]MBW2071174.1 alkaline phosphatase family protein [Deltaproteobacteria bacterium]